jgi:SAM-dependent methyltransferase
MPKNLTETTIQDFGQQWTTFRDNSGWYGSLELFEDIVGPLLTPAELQGKDVVEIGSGTGRIVGMLLAAQVRHVTAVEPSEACQVLKENVLKLPQGAQRVTVINTRGDEWQTPQPVDYVFSIGVLHHIPEPHSSVRTAFQQLKPGGKCFVWLYGYEGNEFYLSIFGPLRALTTRLPHSFLQLVVALIYPLLVLYRFLSRFINLPQKAYIENVIWPMAPDKRRLVIYDQLNPAYAKYYKKAEALELLRAAGFVDVQAHHRHGYSWSVIGTKPLA